MRRWRESASRARRYGATTRRQRVAARARVNFAWLRRGLARARDLRLALHQRLAIALELRMRLTSPRPRAADSAPVQSPARPPLVRWRAEARYDARSNAVPSASPAPTLVHRTLHQRDHVTQSRTTLREHTTSRTDTLRSPHGGMLVHRLLVRQAHHGRSGYNATRPPALHTRITHSSRTVIAQPSVHERRTYPTLPPIASFAHPRRVTTLSRHPSTQAAEPTSGRHPVIAEHVPTRLATPVRAFAVQPQPLAPAPARAAVADPAPLERIERTLRESLTVVAERTVRRELDRTLRPGAPMTRHLRESIQSELYDDIVFERERRGDR